MIILITVPGSSLSSQQAPAISETEQAGVSTPIERTNVSIPEFTYFVRQEDTGARGSAFLLEDPAGVWLISNSHVFSGSTNFTLINIQGNTIEVPVRIETAKDRDIIRFATRQTRGLHLSPSCKQGEKVYAYGDSGGAGVLTKLEGKALALGPDRIEISARIIPGNSGGPVVNENKEVLGVSTYLFRHNLPDWIAEGTRFSDTRRMALKLNEIEWVPVELSEFYRQTSGLAEVEDALHTAIGIVDELSHDTGAAIFITTDNHQLKSWLKKHNQLAKRSSRSSQRELERNIDRFKRLMRDFESDPTPDCEITIPYLKDQLSDMKDTFQAIKDHVEAITD